MTQTNRQILNLCHLKFEKNIFVFNVLFEKKKHTILYPMQFSKLGF